MDERCAARGNVAESYLWPFPLPFDDGVGDPILPHLPYERLRPLLPWPHEMVRSHRLDRIDRRNQSQMGAKNRGIWIWRTEKRKNSWIQI